ncbi:MAG: S8 family serine peptidase, partial [Gammaproteobacteria bacterium]|nr:S8 family serine peptidase [Gammaproteobacteria bacterium]
PNLSAPGVNVYAAVQSPTEYGQLSGTSMSGPHVAGAAALLRQLHPGWTAAEIHTALATTGVRDLRTEEDFPEIGTPFDYGGGTIRVDAAARAGLLMHETTANFQAANPGLGGDPTTLNLPSFGNSQCLEVCTWERTVKATAAATWTVSADSDSGVTINASPQTFSLTEGETQVITVTADVTGQPFGEWLFGWVHLTPDNVAVSPQALPVAVAPTAGILPELLEITAHRDAGSQLIGGFETGSLSNVIIDAYGLSAPIETIVETEGDNGGVFSPYTETGVDISFYDVPAGSVIFSASTANSTAPDIDLFVGRDNNGDGMITADEELCQSGGPVSIERCDLTGADVQQGGSFWVAVVAFEASAPNAIDTTELTVATAAPSTGNFSIEAPSFATPGEAWNIRAFWDESMSAGDMMFGAVEVFGNGESLALIPVELRRGEDDVRITASDTIVDANQPITMTVEVETNLSPEDLFYVIDADIPDGFEYVPGSADVSEGNVYVINNQLIWILPHPTLAFEPNFYETHLNGPGVDPTDPHYNPACDTGFGGYVDLESFGIDANPTISGDTISYFTLEGQNLPFYDKPKTAFTITDDGFGVFASGVGNTPWQNTGIPNDAEPNDMVAIAWTDTEIVYDAATNSGVTIAAPGPNLSVVEFDDMQRYPAGSSSDRIDYQVVFNGAIDDGANKFELVLAYDNIVGDWSDVTVGVENQAGDAGSQYGGALSDGLMICYDYVGPDLSAETMTYQIQAVDASGDIAHELFSIVNMPGSRESSTSIMLTVTADTDADGVGDNIDNCTAVANPDQVDVDQDGFGNACDPDFNQDGRVDFWDLMMMKSMYQTADPLGDLTGDGWVDVADLNVMRSLFFGLPGPSAAGQQ